MSDDQTRLATAITHPQLDDTVRSLLRPPRTTAKYEGTAIVFPPDIPVQWKAHVDTVYPLDRDDEETAIVYPLVIPDPWKAFVDIVCPNANDDSEDTPNASTTPPSTFLSDSYDSLPDLVEYHSPPPSPPVGQT